MINNYLTRGFWGDEAWTAGISRLSIPEIVTITSSDFHPPFYYFLVHYFGGLFAYREIPVRLLSTLFFLLTPLVTYFLLRLLWRNRSTSSKLDSIATALLVLFSPILFTYAFEARSYALLAFGSVLSAYLFWQAKDEKPGKYLWRALYFLLGSVLVYTHYYAWFILASHAVYLLLFERNRLKSMLVSALGILIVQAPWLPTLLGQTSSVKGSYWIAPLNSQTHWEFFLRVTGGDVPTIFQKPLAYLIGGLILLGFITALKDRTLNKSHLFLLSWVIVPTLIPTLLSLTFAPVFFYRYLIFSAIPLLILTVQSLHSLFARQARLFWLSLAVIFIMETHVDFRIFSQYPRTMADAVREMYQSKTPGSSPVYTTLPAFAEVLYYVGDRDQIIVTPEGLVQFSGLSLLDAYVRLGKVTIAEPPTSAPYWFLTPEKKALLKNSLQ